MEFIMNRKHRICVLGGTGFVGRHIVSRLARDGHFIKVLTRRRERHRELLVLPTVKLVEADVRDEQVLTREFAGMDVIINLVGILNERKHQRFRDVHVDIPRRVLAACRKNGIKRVLHMSALNADSARGASLYLRTKGEGENAMHAEAGINVTTFRPSVIYGPDDKFFNQFVRLMKTAPLFFPLACPNAKLAPVFVGDVAESFARAIDVPQTYNQHYDLCGPHAYTLRELVKYARRLACVHRAVIGLSDGMSYLFASLMEFAPGKPLSRDNVLSLQKGSTCSGAFPAVLGIVPASIEAVVPTYLAKRNQRAHYYDYRVQARRK